MSYKYCTETFKWALDGFISTCERLADHPGDHVAIHDGARVEWTTPTPPGVASYLKLLNTVLLGHPVNEILNMNKAPFVCRNGHRWWVFSPERIPGQMCCPFCMGKTG